MPPCLPPDISPSLWASLLCSPTHRCPTAVPASLACCVSHALGASEVCAQATDSARTGSWATGSAAAVRASTGRPVRCARWVATGPTALEVSRDFNLRYPSRGEGRRASRCQLEVSRVTPVLPVPFQSVAVPMGCARRAYKGTGAVSVTWAGRVSAVMRVSLPRGRGLSLGGGVWVGTQILMRTVLSPPRDQQPSVPTM